MEDINGKKYIENKGSYSIMDVVKSILYSVIGVVIFFIPIEINYTTNTIIYHLSELLQSTMAPFLEITILFIIVASLIKLYKCDRKIELTINIFILVILGSILLSEERNIISYDFIIILEEIILNIITVLPISAVFLPLIMDYGLLDIVESYFHKFMKGAFKLSGKTIVNILIFLNTNYFLGYFMTNNMYKKGILREKEAILLYLNFSVMPLYLLKDVLFEFNISKIEFFMLSIIILVLLNMVICRIYPLNKKKNSYYIKTQYKETVHKKNKFQKGLVKYLNSKEDTLLIKRMKSNLEDIVLIILNLVPKLIFIYSVGCFIVYNTGIITIIKDITMDFTKVLKLSDLNYISEYIWSGLFNDIVALELLNKNIAYEAKLLISIMIFIKGISITTNMLYIDHVDIKINNKDFILVYIEKVVLILTIFSLIYYFSKGYLG